MSGWGLVSKGARLARGGELEPARDLLGQAARSLPDKAGPRIQLGLCLLEENRAEEALETLLEAARLEPANPAVPLFAAVACSDLGQVTEAQRWRDRVRELSPTNQALPTLEALLELRAGRPREALQRLGYSDAPPASVWTAPEVSTSAPLASRLVFELEKLRLPMDVPRLRRSGPAVEPEEIPQARRLPLLLLYLVMLTFPCLLALLAMQFYVTREPVLGQALLAMVTATVALAVMIFKTPAGQKAFPTVYARSLQRRGLSLVESTLRERSVRPRLRIFEQAIAYLRQSRELAPDLFRADFYLGEALLFAALALRESPEESERSDTYLSEAAECFTHSWAQDGGNPYVHYYLARSCLLLGQVERSQSLFEMALAQFEKLPEANYGVGQCRLLLGDFEGARRFLWKAASCEMLTVRERLAELERLLDEQAHRLGRPLPPMPEAPPEPEEPAPAASEGGAGPSVENATAEAGAAAAEAGAAATAEPAASPDTGTPQPAVALSAAESASPYPEPGLPAGLAPGLPQASGAAVEAAEGRATAPTPPQPASSDASAPTSDGAPSPQSDPSSQPSP